LPCCDFDLNDDVDLEQNDNANLHRNKAISLKLKPLFEVNDRVYALFKDSRCWYKGVVTNHTTARNSEYGPVRIYDVLFDDGDKDTGIFDYNVFSEKDYILQEEKEGKKPKWTGVTNKTDETSTDDWARIVGWYNVKIGKLCLHLTHCVHVFVLHN
jgi:hypothetical protein